MPRSWRAPSTSCGQQPSRHVRTATGLIHADLHYENFLFHDGVARAIDFDDCGWGFYLYDVAVTLWELEEDASTTRGYATRSLLSTGTTAGCHRTTTLTCERCSCSAGSRC